MARHGHRSAAAALILAVPLALQAAEFTVSPLRIELGSNARSGALTVRNDDRGPLSFQVRAMTWSQDEDGRDVYTDAADLIHFPRLLTLAPGAEAVIRVGHREAAVAVEKAYRLFIEELPAAQQQASATGPQVRVLVRFGAPVLVRPVQAASQLSVEGLALRQGQVSWTMTNAGNQHELFESADLQGLDAAGHEVFAQPVALRYVLAGRTRTMTVPVAPQACAQLATLHLSLKTERIELKRQLDLPLPSCQ